MGTTVIRTMSVTGRKVTKQICYFKFSTSNAKHLKQSLGAIVDHLTSPDEVEESVVFLWQCRILAARNPWNIEYIQAVDANVRVVNTDWFLIAINVYTHLPTKFSKTLLLPALWLPTTAIWGKSIEDGCPICAKASWILFITGIRSSMPLFPILENGKKHVLQLTCRG